MKWSSIQRKTRCGEFVIGGEPSHIEVRYLKEPRIWYAEARDKTGNLLDMERREGDIRSGYIEDYGNRQDAITGGIAMGAWHGIPVNIMSGGNVIKRIKPKF